MYIAQNKIYSLLNFIATPYNCFDFEKEKKVRPTAKIIFTILYETKILKT